MDSDQLSDMDDYGEPDEIDEFTGIDTSELAEIRLALDDQVEEFVTQAYEEDIRPLEFEGAQSLLHSITVTLQTFVQRSTCLQTRCLHSVFRCLVQLGFHPQGFTIAVDFLLQLVEKHSIDDTVLKPWLRTPGEKLLFAKMLIDECEYQLIVLIAIRWLNMFEELEAPHTDPTLLPDNFFEKYTSATECMQILDYIPRMIVHSHTRQVTKTTACEAGGHLLTPEIVEIVQDFMCDSESVPHVIHCMRDDYLEDMKNYKFGDPSKWLQETFNEAEL